MNLDEIPPDGGLSIKAVRDLFGLDAMRVQPHAKRPPCATCGRAVVKHSYHHTANGVVCHTCLYGRRRVEPMTEPRPRRVTRNRWDNYVRPVVYCACGKPMPDKRAKHCWDCEMQRRRGTKNPEPIDSGSVTTGGVNA